MEKIEKYYERLLRSIELVVKGDFNSLFVKSRAGLGKSYWIDNQLTKLKANSIVLTGEISDAYFYKFLYENRTKVIVFRDIAKLIRRLTIIDTLKSLTEVKGKRTISRLKFGKMEGNEEIPKSFEFKGSIIFEINEILGKYQEDLAALFSRGDFVELNLSFKQVKNIMRIIAKTPDEIEATEYLIKNYQFVGITQFNLRLQQKIITIHRASKRDKLSWKKQIDLFLKSEMSEARKLLYELVGTGKARRIEFVRFLILVKGYAYATAQRKINDFIALEEIFSDGKLKQSKLSINPRSIKK